ncbi:hypothetical protein [Thalassococcus sp. S3]|uniref:hypothetical protein n=1 Tax=Thalassococcus sp. S3 TaxID=2017482 RepID=UPI0010246393|nr:hypothetical protein [Thalassococcus sp. S3]QBF31278.1 hypothetical protein CFI11_08615 [Thalassococcus sp. S3]
MNAPFAYTTQGRTWRAGIVVGLIYVALAAIHILFDARLWIIALLALSTLPALYDLYVNPSAGLRLDQGALDWHSGRRSVTLSLSEIDHMRFDTRLDLSVRVSAVLKSQKRIRVPHEALPDHKTLETAFEERGIRVERHHFSLLG